VTPTVPKPMRVLAWLTFGVTFVVLYIGTLVTGSGPHAGDAQSPRTGMDTEAISQLHADLVALLIGLTVGLLFGLRAVGAPARARRAIWWLLTAELAQGVVGIVQYLTDLPVILVGIHMLGAALITAAATAVVLSTRDRVSDQS
jgi:heme a synthase